MGRGKGTSRGSMCRAISATLALVLCIGSAPRAEAVGAGLALGGLQDLPLVAWQFDQSTGKLVGPAGGVQSFKTPTGIPPYASSLIDCVVTNDGKQAYVATSDYFILAYNLSAKGPALAKQIVVGYKTASAKGASFQSLDISPSGKLVALCGTTYAKAGFVGPRGALWLLDAATGRVAAVLTSTTLEYCVSASFCDNNMVVASFQSLTDLTNQLKVFTLQVKGSKSAWGQRTAGHVLAGASKVVSQVACAGGFAAVTRGVQAPIQVDSWVVPRLLYQGTWTGRADSSAFVISVALDRAHSRVLVRTNSSVYLVPYDKFGHLAKAASLELASPCTNCHTSGFFTYFGVHSAGVTVPTFGSKAYLTGPDNEILVMDLASKPPKFLAPIPIAGAGAGIEAVCLQQ